MRHSAIDFAVRLIIALATAIAFYRVTLVPLAANQERAYVAARTMRAFEGIGSLRALDIARSNLSRIERLKRSTPPSVDLLLLEGANLQLIQRCDEAIAAYKACLLLEKRPETYFDLGRAESDCGDFRNGIEHLALAVAFNPSMGDEIGPGTTRDAVMERVRTLLSPSQIAR